MTKSEKGMSLIETAIALGVLSVGALGTAAVFSQGMERTKSSPGDLIATQKAQEAIESVFSARDSGVLSWAQMRNVNGESGTDGGIFLDAESVIRQPGADGLVGTADDGAVEDVIYPGRDGLLDTADDTHFSYEAFKRKITIRDLRTDLRSITVEVSYKSGSSTRTFTLTAYMSNRS
jgi:hypothetical protein